MAILKGIEASVIIDGKALTEYDDEDMHDKISDHTSKVSKYIEAVSGPEFSISITVPKSYKFEADAISFKLSLDGSWVRNYLCRKAKLKDLREDWHKTIAGSNVKNGKEWHLRPFKFDEIKIVEAPTSTAGSGKSDSVAHLGTILLEVFDRQVTRKSCNSGSGAVRLGRSSEIAEKKLKGRNATLQANFGESRSSTESNHYKARILNAKPILSFKFNYRSRSEQQQHHLYKHGISIDYVTEALQCLRLIPMTPSPSPVPTPVPLEERPFDSLTPEEVQELARKLHAKYQAEREANIKREADIKPEANIKSEKIKSERGVKREHDQEYENMVKSSTAKKVKARPFQQGETIELD